MNSEVLFEIMKHVDSDTLDSFKSVNKESLKVSEDLLLKIERAIVCLKNEFQIHTIIIDNIMEDNHDVRYEYTCDIENHLFVMGNNPHEFLCYRRDLINGRIKSKQIEVPSEIYNDDTEYVHGSDDNIYEIDDNIREYIIEQGVKRGDIIHLETYGDYRDDGLYIFNGRNVVCLTDDGSSDDLCVSKEFNVCNEFPPNYWNYTTSLRNNRIYVKLNESEIDQVIESLEVLKDDKDDKVNNSFRDYIGYFTKNTRKYRIVFAFDDYMSINDELKELIRDHISVEEYYQGIVDEGPLIDVDDPFTLYCYICVQAD